MANDGTRRTLAGGGGASPLPGGEAGAEVVDNTLRARIADLLGDHAARKEANARIRKVDPRLGLQLRGRPTSPAQPAWVLDPERLLFALRVLEVLYEGRLSGYGRLTRANFADVYATWHETMRRVQYEDDARLMRLHGERPSRVQKRFPILTRDALP